MALFRYRAACTPLLWAAAPRASSRPFAVDEAGMLAVDTLLGL